MRNFQDTFEIRKRSFIGAFSICMTVPLTIFVNQEVNVRFSKKLAHFVKSVLRFSLLPYCQRNKPFIAVTLESIVCFKHNFTKNSAPQSDAEMFDFCEIDTFIQVGVCTLMISNLMHLFC